MDEPITMQIKGMQAQNEYFKQLEPSPFKRVFLMANDIRRKVDLQRERAEAERESKKKNPYGVMKHE